MFYHPTRAVISCGTGLSAAGTVRTQPTGGFYHPDVSPCTLMTKVALNVILSSTDGAVKYIGVDGDRVATVAYKKPLTLWDLESGRAIRTVDNDLGVSR